MNYKKRTEEWYKRALEETDEFVKFLLLFISYEVSVKSKGINLKDVKHDNSIKNKFYNKIDFKDLEKLKQTLDKNPLKNMKDDGDNRWSGKIESVNDFDGIIEFVIRARNNLFHGDKGLDEKRDELIVKEGTIILQPLVEAIIL